MDTQTIDQEYQKLQAEFQDVAKTVQALAAKMRVAEQAGDANATAWLDDLKRIAQDIDDEQTQAKVLLLALHSFVSGLAEAPQPAPGGSEEHPPLFAPGHEPRPQQQQQPQPLYQAGPGGMMGAMLGGPMLGGYFGGGFARAMGMGAGMSLGASLVNSIFR